MDISACQRNEGAILAVALALIENPLVDTAYRYLPLARTLTMRLQDVGVKDEVLASRYAEQAVDLVGPNQDRQLFAAYDTINASLFQPRRGLLLLRECTLARQVGRLIDADLSVCFNLPRDRGTESYDWSAVPMTDQHPGAAVLREQSVDTHIHLGGTLPALFGWLVLMSGMFPLETLCRVSREERRQASDRTWQRVVLLGMALRFKLAAYVKAQSAHLSRPHFYWLDDGFLKSVAERTTTDQGVSVRLRDIVEDATAESRELAVRLRDMVGELTVATRYATARAERDHIGRGMLTHLFDDPLARPDGGMPLHYAATERQLLACTAYFLRQIPDPAHEAVLFEYVRLRNAFHAWMNHDHGSNGLTRFVENFDRRGFIFNVAGPSCRQRRAHRQRRALDGLESTRVLWALRSQLHEPFCATTAVSRSQLARRRIELRVSPTEKHLLRNVRAWLHGLRAFLNNCGVLLGQRPVPPQAQVGLLFHFIKRRVDATSPERYQHTARKIWSLLHDYPDLRHFVVGVDAAGFERATPPRTFGLAYQLLHDRLNSVRDAYRSCPVHLGWTYHVAEDVADYLTGLRHIHEVVRGLFRDEPGRLGHALILGQQPAAFYAARGRGVAVTEGTHALDLIWLYGRLAAHGNSDHLTFLLDRLGKLQIDRPFSRGDVTVCYERMQAFAPYLSEAALLQSIAGVQFDPEALIAIAVDDTWLAVLLAARNMLFQELTRRPLCIEANPTSNLLVGGYTNYEDLPYNEFTKVGLAVSINTDDPGLFCSTLAGEFSALYEASVKQGRPHGEAMAWLRDRCHDAHESTFLGSHVPTGVDALKLLKRPDFGRYYST